MTIETLLMQYQSEYQKALKSVVNIHKTFDWFAFNKSIINEHLTGKRIAIAIDPSYIPKTGKKTPWIDNFWSGCAGDFKRGLEIMGIGVIDIDNHECMTLGSIQTPDGKTLKSVDKNLVDWYSSYLIVNKDQLQSISIIIVADAFFSKETFITHMCNNGFNVVSRFRNDDVLYYLAQETQTGKLYGLRIYAKALKKFVSLAVWYPMDGREILDFYRTRFQLEFCFIDSKQHAGMTNCQSTDFR